MAKLHTWSQRMRLDPPLTAYEWSDAACGWSARTTVGDITAESCSAMWQTKSGARNDAAEVALQSVCETPTVHELRSILIAVEALKAATAAVEMSVSRLAFAVSLLEEPKE